MTTMRFIAAIVVHLAFVVAILSSLTEQVRVYRSSAVLFVGALAFMASQVFSAAGFAAMLVGLLVMPPAVIILASRLLFFVTVRKGFPGNHLTVAGAYRFLWSLQWLTCTTA